MDKYSWYSGSGTGANIVISAETETTARRMRRMSEVTAIKKEVTDMVHLLLGRRIS